MAHCCIVIGGRLFSTSELLYPIMENRFRLIRARNNFYMIRNNPNVSLGVVICSIYIRRFALKDHHHKKRMDMIAYTSVEFNYLESHTNTFIIPAEQNQFIWENIFITAPVRRIAIAKHTMSAFTGSHTENHSGINNLASDYLECSEEVSPS